MELRTTTVAFVTPEDLGRTLAAASVGDFADAMLAFAMELKDDEAKKDAFASALVPRQGGLRFVVLDEIVRLAYFHKESVRRDPLQRGS